MTTIAIKDGIVAYDSRITQGGVVLDNDFDKKTSRKGVSFFVAGNMTDDEAVMKYYFKGKDIAEDIKVDGTPEADFIIVDGKKAYYGGMSEDTFWKMEIRTTTAYAVGSGAAYAIGAMDAGATAEEAVKIASRDVYTGGTIRTHLVK